MGRPVRRRSVAKGDRSRYPGKATLWDALEAAHARAAKATGLCTPGRLAEVFPDPTFREIMPTVGDGVVHLLTTHEAGHAGPDVGVATGRGDRPR